MHGIWIALSTRVSEAQVGEHLQRWFPRVEIMPYAAALAADRKPWPPIVFSVDERPSVEDFPTTVHFDCFPGPDSAAVGVGIALARRFSDALRCRALCDGTGLGDDPGPTWGVIWERGKAVLADDGGSAFGDGEGGPVRAVRDLVLQGMDLDPGGILVPR
jgi:hypothetical protein